MKINTVLYTAGTILLNIAGSLCQLDVCGQVSQKTRIIGGVDAKPGSWPWQVSIHQRFFGGHFCGGSLINKDWVLSAAHCFNNYSASDIVMYFGRRSQSGSNPYETYRTASRVIKHPDYNNLMFSNDIALVQLSSSVNFSDIIKPVCLAAAGSVFAGGAESWVTGWGTLQSGGQYHDILQEVMIPIVKNDACYNAYGEIITNEVICAGFLNVGGKSPCLGDSGGPLVSRSGSRWIQFGIVNFGKARCDDPKYPTVYARVSQFQNWIMSSMGSNPPGFIVFNSSGFRSSLNLLLFPISLTFSIIPFTFSMYLSS